MRHRVVLFLLVVTPPACMLVAKSPALQSPLHERLAKADGTRIEEAARECLTAQGWKPDDVSGYVEGATAVSAKNSAKERVTIYIQSPEMNPRVTGGPDYDDPFWGCLASDLGGAKPVSRDTDASPGNAP